MVAAQNILETSIVTLMTLNSITFAATSMTLGDTAFLYGTWKHIQRE